MKQLAWTVALVLLTRAAARPAENPQGKPADPTGNVKVEESRLAPTGQLYDSEKKRDPFLNPLLLKKAASDDPEQQRGQPPLGIAGMLISQVAFLGTSLRQGISTAVFRGNDKRFYFLHENDRFFDGFLKKIQGDSAVMVREKRLRSGKVETEEITRHLRTP